MEGLVPLCQDFVFCKLLILIILHIKYAEFIFSNAGGMRTSPGKPSA